jgi:hypothetical protein
MIELIDDLPDYILAIRATGRVTGDDYKNIVSPAVETKRAAHDKLHLLFHIPPTFKMFTTTALWDDAHIGLHRLRGFGRVAVVTDIDWLKTLANGIEPLESTEIRVFAHGRFDEARDWTRG